jgi:WD40 repeat protein
MKKKIYATPTASFTMLRDKDISIDSVPQPLYSLQLASKISQLCPIGNDRFVGICGKNIKILDFSAESGVIQTLPGHRSEVTKVIPTDDNQLISISTDRTIGLWNLETGMPINIFKGFDNTVWDAWLLDNAYIIGYSHDRNLKAWDAQTGALIYENQDSMFLENKPILLSTGQFLCLSKNKGQFKIIDVRNSEERTIDAYDGEVSYVKEISGGRILSASIGQLTLRDISTLEIIAEGQLEGDKWDRTKHVYELSSGNLVCLAGKPSLQIVDGETLAKISTLEGHSGYDCNNVALQQVGSDCLVSYQQAKEIIAWNLDSGEIISNTSLYRPTFFGSNPSFLANGLVAALPDGYGDDKGAIRVWDPVNDRFEDVKSGTDRVTSFAVQNGQLLTVSNDNRAMLWNMSGCEEIVTQRSLREDTSMTDVSIQQSVAAIFVPPLEYTFSWPPVNWPPEVDKERFSFDDGWTVASQAIQSNIDSFFTDRSQSSSFFDISWWRIPESLRLVLESPLSLFRVSADSPEKVLREKGMHALGSDMNIMNHMNMFWSSGGRAVSNNSGLISCSSSPEGMLAHAQYIQRHNAAPSYTYVIDMQRRTGWADQVPTVPIIAIDAIIRREYTYPVIDELGKWTLKEGFSSRSQQHLPFHTDGDQAAIKAANLKEVLFPRHIPSGWIAAIFQNIQNEFGHTVARLLHDYTKAT